MKKLGNKNGLTFIELMIVLVLLGVILAIVYNYFYYTKKTYSSAEKKWIAQSNARQAAEFINTELKTAYYAEINYTEDWQEGYTDLYLENGKIMHKKDDEPVQITDGNYTVTFEKAKKSTWSEDSPESDRINNTITYTIDVLDTDGTTVLYTLQSSVFMENMIEDRAVTAEYTGDKLRYQRTSKETPIPTASCFIATASYGSPNDSSVVLLRQFRDEVLLTNAPGRAFVEFYYKVSPPIAKMISKSDVLKFTARLLLTPLVGIASIFIYREMLYFCIILVMIWFYFRKEKYTSWI